MSMMVSELYDALIEAGASEEKARSAAQALADHESRFTSIDAELKLHRWMLTLIIGGVLALVLKTFFIP